MQRGRGAIVAAAVGLATAVSAAIPGHAAAYSMEIGPQDYEAGCEAGFVAVTNALARRSATPEDTELRVGARLALWVEASQPLTFAITANRPVGYGEPTTHQEPPPGLAPELEGGLGTAPQETQGFSVFYSTKATAEPGTIYWQASFVAPASLGCPENVIRTPIHAVLITFRRPTAEQPEPQEAPLTQPAQKPHSQSQPCLVPSLRGRSLRATRDALRRNHCKLGKVTMQREHDANVVVHQSRRAGARLPQGTAIAITLGRTR